MLSIEFYNEDGDTEKSDIEDILIYNSRGVKLAISVDVYDEFLIHCKSLTAKIPKEDTIVISQG